jgi:hypothetical protein
MNFLPSNHSENEQNRTESSIDPLNFGQIHVAILDYEPVLHFLTMTRPEIQTTSSGHLVVADFQVYIRAIVWLFDQAREHQVELDRLIATMNEYSKFQ